MDFKLNFMHRLAIFVIKFSVSAHNIKKIWIAILIQKYRFNLIGTGPKWCNSWATVTRFYANVSFIFNLFHEYFRYIFLIIAKSFIDLLGLIIINFCEVNCTTTKDNKSLVWFLLQADILIKKKSNL